MNASLPLFRTHSVGALILAVLSVLWVTTLHAAPFPVTKGKADLSSWNFSTNGPVRLSGQWGFHWETGKNTSAKPSGDYYPIPALWRGTSAAGTKLDARGNAAYHAQILLPERHPETLALLVAGGLSVCEILVDGVPLAASGMPGTSRTTERPERHFVSAAFTPASNTFSITLRVSNHHNVQGGLNGEVVLGSAQQIATYHDLPRLLSAFMAGGLICLFLLYVSLFLMRRSGREYLYFGLFCLFWCVAILFSPSSGFLMARLAPAIPWAWYVNCSMLPYAATVPLMLMFYQRLFPKPFGRLVERSFTILGLCLAVYILATPPNAYDDVLLAYFLVGSSALVYMFACFTLDLFRREKGVWILVFGYLALAVAELDDILFDIHIIDVPSLRPAGVFLFTLSYAFYLAYRHSRVLTRTQHLAEELDTINARLVRTDRLKDEFLANTTHELKTPLAGMIGIAETLMGHSDAAPDSTPLPDTTKRHLAAIVHSGRRLAKLIDDVLDFSRLRNRDITLRPVRTDLSRTTRQVIGLLQGIGHGNSVVLENKLPQDFPPVLADPDRLEQVLFNLLGNGLKFTDSGSVSVSAEIHDNVAEILVSDTGHGIPKDDLKRIFRPYEQAGNTISGGMGIGLCIAGHLVELHGGTLTASSEPKKGSVFRFTLPLAEREYTPSTVETAPPPAVETIAEQAAQSPASPGQTKEPANTDCRVLIVDDEPLNLTVASSILDLDGLPHCTATGGHAALRMIENGLIPDLVLLDVMMPDIDGFSVCRRLRRRFTASELPIVMLTVRNRQEDIVEGFAAGANDYLTKPFSSDELRARIRTQLRQREAYAALAENTQLRREVEMRRATESRLRLMRRRLATLFDRLDHAVLVVNASREIVFCNVAFRSILEHDKDLLGHPLASLLADASSGPGRKLMAFCRKPGATDTPDETKARVVFHNLDMRCGERSARVHVRAHRMEVEEETLCLMSFAPEESPDRIKDGVGDGGNGDMHGERSSVRLLGELAENRRRVAAIEEAVLSAELGHPEQRHRLMNDIKALDTLLNAMETRMRTNPRYGEQRILAVTVMNSAVDCWVESTGTTKADMAEQSGLWRVYMERDGYLRTQTLDKYLSPETLPANPRWRNIFLTAEFVLANCEQASSRTSLSYSLNKLKAVVNGQR